MQSHSLLALFKQEVMLFFTQRGESCDWGCYFQKIQFEYYLKLILSLCLQYNELNVFVEQLKSQKLFLSESKLIFFQAENKYKF